MSCPMETKVSDMTTDMVFISSSTRQISCLWVMEERSLLVRGRSRSESVLREIPSLSSMGRERGVSLEGGDCCRIRL